MATNSARDKIVAAQSYGSRSVSRLWNISNHPVTSRHHWGIQNPNLTRFGAYQPENCPHQSCFARSIRAQNANERTPFNGNIDVGYDNAVAQCYGHIIKREVDYGFAPISAVSIACNWVIIQS